MSIPVIGADIKSGDLSRRKLATLLLLAGCRSPVSHVRHVVRNAGSDTMVNVAQAWAEHYLQVDSSVSVEVSGGGSATGIAALIDGAADIANSSRRIHAEEIQAALRKTGKQPKEWIAGDDALAVFVHRDNPIESLTLQQLAQIYGRDGSITHWRQLGVDIPGEIVLISRQSNSGTFEYFRKSILGKTGDFRQGTRDLNGSKEVVTLIGQTRGAIGYSGMGYATNEVKMLKIARDAARSAVVPSAESTRNGSYPIARPLYMYTLGDPSPIVRQYLDWILSPPGQQIVGQSGYVPLKGAI